MVYKGMLNICISHYFMTRLTATSADVSGRGRNQEVTAGLGLRKGRG